MEVLQALRRLEQDGVIPSSRTDVVELLQALRIHAVDVAVRSLVEMLRALVVKSAIRRNPQCARRWRARLAGGCS